MQLELKPDFDVASARWRSYWEGGIQDRPMLAIAVPRRGIAPPPRPHPYDMPVQDADVFAGRVLEWASAFEWLADSIPGYQVTFAPDHFALLLGANWKRSEEPGGSRTVWVEPFLLDYDQEIRFQPESRWWQKTVECVSALRRCCAGRLIVSWTHFQGGLDALSAIRGPQELLFDLIERPEDVRSALRRIDVAVDDARRAFAAELDVPTWGTITRHGTYFPGGLVDIPQCDFSAMISEDMFREFGLPSLVHECRMLDAAVYHLDGPDAIKHLPMIAEIDKITQIQWQPGAGNAATQDWSELYRRIDAFGKGQFRSGGPELIRRLWREYKCRNRLFIGNVTGISGKDEAQRFLDEWPSLSY